MKHILKQIMAAIIFSVLFCIVLPTTAQAGGYYLGAGKNLSWTFENEILTISGVGSMNDFTPEIIPEWYGLKPKKVVVEEGVTNIGNYAFQKSYKIESISLPNSVKTIGEHAFLGCTSLKNISLPNSVKTIGKYAFDDCGSLKNISLPNNVKTIGEAAFWGCGLESCMIPSGVKVIERQTFQDCKFLKTVTIPNTVTKIKSFAFRGCSSLKKVHIPGSVTNIGEGAFYRCMTLSDVKFSEGLKIIGEGAFWWGCNASSITIPSTVTKIEKYAFDGNPKIKKIYFLGKKPSIDKDAFSSVTATAYYPASWKKAPAPYEYGYLTWKQSSTALKKGDIATDKTTNGVYKVTGKDTVTYQKPSTKKSAVTIPAKVKLNKVNYKVTAIADNAFSGDATLRKVMISSNVKKIGKKAFYKCKNLKTITIKTTTLKKGSVGADAFKGIYAKATIKVPKKQLKSYKAILRSKGVSSKANIKK